MFGEHKITNLFTAGPRIGYAWDRVMIFATGAGRWANLVEHPLLVHHRSLRRTRLRGNGASRSNNGWYAGGGFDYMVHKGSLVDVLLGVDISTSRSVSRRRSASIRAASRCPSATLRSALGATSCAPG